MAEISKLEEAEKNLKAQELKMVKGYSTNDVSILKSLKEVVAGLKSVNVKPEVKK